MPCSSSRTIRTCSRSRRQTCKAPPPWRGEFCLAGFGIDKDAATGRKRDKPFLAFDVTYSGDERGYILASKPAEDGYSGGGAFRDGALMGMIVRRTTPPASVIVPIGFIVDFVAPEGIYLDLDKGRKFEPGVPPSQLSFSIDKNLSRIEGNRLDIEKILRSVEWLVELSEPVTEPKLVLTPDRSFTIPDPGRLFHCRSDRLFRGQRFRDLHPR